jgi:hypothetical protein
MRTAHESERTARDGGGGGGGEAGDRAHVEEDLRNKAVERLKARGADVKAAKQKPHLLKPPQFTHWNQKELADKEEDWQAKRDKEVATARMPMHH